MKLIGTRMVCVAALAGLIAQAARASEPNAPLEYSSRQADYEATDDELIDSTHLVTQIEPVAEAAPIEEMPEEPESVAPWNDVEMAGDPDSSLACDTCDSCDTCGGRCCSRGCLGGLWYGSIDYLLFRPRMSQAVAEVRRVQQIDTSTTPNTVTLTDTVVQYPFSYESGFRVAAGYRLLECGGDIQVDYWRMSNGAQYSDGPADVSNNNPTILGNLGNNPGDGEYLDSATEVTANIFDVTFSKLISSGGACNCPRWDLRFFGGARIADISRYNNNVVVAANGIDQSYGSINARFVGAGPRVGIKGRRYLGYRGRWSLYSKAGGALLIGDYRMGRSLNVPGEDSTTPNEITNENNFFNRMIPAADIELGGSVQLGPHAFITVGYFFQCWWDLGQAENIQGTSFGGLDSANILSFDGLFVRGELLF